MSSNSYCILMAGGIGSRFWPMSRNHCPKQFLDILNIGKTLLQQTFERVQLHTAISNIYVVTHHSYLDLVTQQIPQIPKEQILLEPFGRNTAPCVAYGLFKINKKNPEANVVICPADHLITNEQQYAQTIVKAVELAQKNPYLITMGIQPTHPNTGYGYIQYIQKQDNEGVFKVKTFTEKPSIELAKTFVQSGDFLWNSGIFIANVSTWLQAFKQYLPEMHSSFESISHKLGTKLEAQLINHVYQHCLNISIDNGIMEHANNVYVIPVDFGWSDLGTWNALHEHLPQDGQKNTVIGNVMLYNTQNTLVCTNNKEKLIVVEGLQNMLVIEYDNAILICPKSSEQHIRHIVNELKSLNKTDYI
ncbi:MAG: mannose-1-phosphate guanylyltransferase [Bacteroidia bacterium]|nr:mannose-1-phosphate guanylyltransferase [Bacteroidia bacterium]MDW8347447.1 mannose-1-phosphate guanylyltransferase [Bacteroidia bacterium]